MKNMLFEVFVCMMLIGTFFVVTLDTVSADREGDYFYNVSNGRATITGYTGTDTAVTIPSTLGGYPTVAIADSAFWNCHSLTSVTIPDSVTGIHVHAFQECSNLTAVTIGNGVTVIAQSAFNGCNSLTSMTFLGLVAPTTVGTDWILNTPVGIRGHAYAASNFPSPGEDFHGLIMGTVIGGGNEPGNGDQTPEPKTPGFELVFVIGTIAVAMFLWRKKRNV